MENSTAQESLSNEIKLEELPLEKVRELRKEYNTTVMPCATFLRIFAFVLLLAAMGLGGFFLFNLLKSVFKDTGTRLLWWGMGASSAPLCALSTALVAYIQNGFTKWLWKEKNILSKEWRKKKNLSGSSEKRVYKELTKKKRRALRKEFFVTADHKDKKSWRSMAVAYALCIGLIVSFALFSLVKYIFFSGHINYLWLSLFWLLSICFTAFFLIVYPLAVKYFAWLEYEKNIKTK